MKKVAPSGQIYALERIISSRKQGKKIGNSYTQYLFRKGRQYVGRKIHEETDELLKAMRTKSGNVHEEAADVLYHYLVLVNQAGISLTEIEKTLSARQNKETVVVFDFDGTLVNTLRPSYNAFRSLDRLIGGQGVTFEKYCSVFGQTWERMCEAFWPGVDLPHIQDLYDKHGLSPDYPLNTGVRTMLKDISFRHYHIGILSNRNRQSIVNHLRMNSVDPSMFEFIYGPDELNYTKPDKRIFNRILAEFGTGKRYFYVGDMISDYLSTVDTPVTFLAYPNALVTEAKFVRAGVNKSNILRSMSRLHEYIK